MILNQESDSYFGYYVWMTSSNLGSQLCNSRILILLGQFYL